MVWGGGEEGDEGVGEKVVTEDVRCKNLSEWRLVWRGFIVVFAFRHYLRSSRRTDAAQSILRICDSWDQVCEDGPYGPGPINTRATTNACIADDSIKVGKMFEKSSSEVLDRT